MSIGLVYFVPLLLFPTYFLLVFILGPHRQKAELTFFQHTFFLSSSTARTDRRQSWLFCNILSSCLRPRPAQTEGRADFFPTYFLLVFVLSSHRQKEELTCLPLFLFVLSSHRQKAEPTCLRPFLRSVSLGSIKYGCQHSRLKSLLSIVEQNGTCCFIRAAASMYKSAIKTLWKLKECPRCR